MGRVKWSCPGCKKTIRVPEGTDLILCPDCRVESSMKPIKRKTSIWTASDIAFLVVVMMVFFGVVIVAAKAFWPAPATTDPAKLLVEQWLREHLDDGQWDEVRWWPAKPLQRLYDANLLHIVENMEKEKAAFEKGWGKEENNEELQKHYHKFRETGPRTFCAMKCRVTTLNGQGKALRSHVFEIVDGKVAPLPGNEFVEVPSSPFPQAIGISYDAWRYFDDRDYDPFPAVPPNLDERAKAAMIWNPPVNTAPAAPLASAPLTASVAPAQPQTPSLQTPTVAAGNAPAVAANVPATSQKAGANVPDNIPAKIREYFDRTMEAKSAEIKKLEARIAGFQSKFNAAKKLDQKMALTERIKQTEDTLAELKRSNGTAYLPDKLDVGDIGSFQSVEVTEVVDETTLIVRWFPNGKGRIPRIDVAITPIETKEIKNGDTTMGADLFKVTATKDEPSVALKALKDDGKIVEVVAEPVDYDEIEKWRARYDKEDPKRK